MTLSTVWSQLVRVKTWNRVKFSLRRKQNCIFTRPWYRHAHHLFVRYQLTLTHVTSTTALQKPNSFLLWSTVLCKTVKRRKLCHYLITRSVMHKESPPPHPTQRLSTVLLPCQPHETNRRGCYGNIVLRTLNTKTYGTNVLDKDELIIHNHLFTQVKQ